MDTRAGGPLRPLLDVLFPPICLGCGALSRGPHAHLCPACLDSLRPLGDRACCLCGEPFPHDPVPHPCLDCLRDPPPFSWCRSLYAYEGTMKTSLSLLKYGRRLSLLAPLQLSFLVGARAVSLPAADAVVPVPLSAWGAGRRTFNQAMLLAAPLARERGWPLVADALARRHGAPNASLPQEARRLAARRAFTAGRGMARVEGRTVLLVDDVYTSGATAAACARVLARGGARTTVLTLARTPRRR
jgi:ComF family protein